MYRWTLSGAELVHLMREKAIRPGPGSPLGDIKAPTHAAILNPVERQSDLSRALSILAEPKVILGAMTYAPPEEPDYSWYYGAGQGTGWAFHRESQDGGSEIVWPVDAPQLLRSLGAPLALEGGSSGDETSMVFDKDGFEALAVAADLAQEMSLLALLNRKGFSGMSFGEGEFLECARRSGGSDDLRWTAPRFRLVSPVDLSYDENGLRRGLRSLEAGGLVRRVNGQFELSPALGSVCAQMSATNGVAALSVRHMEGGMAAGGGPTSGWAVSHIAAVRAGAGLWLFEFSRISSAGFEARLTCAGPDKIYRRLKTELGHSPQPGFCRQCGGPLRDGAAFCPQCGGALK